MWWLSVSFSLPWASCILGGHIAYVCYYFVHCFEFHVPVYSCSNLDRHLFRGGVSLGLECFLSSIWDNTQIMEIWSWPCVLCVHREEATVLGTGPHDLRAGKGATLVTGFGINPCTGLKVSVVLVIEVRRWTWLFLFKLLHTVLVRLIMECVTIALWYFIFQLCSIGVRQWILCSLLRTCHILCSLLRTCVVCYLTHNCFLILWIEGFCFSELSKMALLGFERNRNWVFLF